MNFTGVEWIALFFSALIVIKLFFVIFNRKFWVNKVARKIYKFGAVSAFVFLVLSGVILYYLIQTMSIVQIFAVMALAFCLMGVGIVQYSNEMQGLMAKVLKEKIGFGIALYIILWVALTAWALYEIFI